MVNFQEIPKYIKARVPAKTPQKIPRQIVQTHETSYLPERMVKNIYTWIDLNPTYDYYFFDKDDRIKFIKEYFDDWVLDMYNQVIPGAMKADIFRFCFMYIKGGIYTDIDQTCLCGFDKLIEPDDDLVTGVCRNTPHQSLIITSPNNPIFMAVLRQGYERIKNNSPLIGHWGYVGGFLGPAAYTYAWQWFHNNRKDPEIGEDDKWLFEYPFKIGKYTIEGFTFNVKNYSLFLSPGYTEGKIKIATIKYPGYNEDNTMIKNATHYEHFGKSVLKK